MAFVLVVIWPGYWSTIGKVPWQIQAHGVAASASVILVATQRWRLGALISWAGWNAGKRPVVPTMAVPATA